MHAVLSTVGVSEGLVRDVELAEGFGLLLCAFDSVSMNSWFGVFCVV